MNLYRAVSAAEYNDWQSTGRFQTAENTIEGKQFFKTENAVKEFVREARRQNYIPSYMYFFYLTIDAGCLDALDYDRQLLDSYLAITVYEDDLPAFNNCINFVISHAIGHHI